MSEGQKIIEQLDFLEQIRENIKGEVILRKSHYHEWFVDLYDKNGKRRAFNLSNGVGEQDLSEAIRLTIYNFQNR